MNLFSKERKGTSFHNISHKDQKFERKFTFDISKFKFQFDSNRKFQILGFFETKRSVGTKPPKKCANIIADSETVKRYGDFDT